MSNRPIKRALIAVYDKTGISDFARALVDEFGIEIVSTGGTAKHLKEHGIPVTMVEDVTGFPEMLDGRVKTLHPKIHAAILADRDNPGHMRQLAEQGIEPIDMVVVNLYPFEKTVADPNCTFEQAIEMIDIGGPCLLRAAAKNHRHVLVVADFQSYPLVLERLGEADRELESRTAEVLFVDGYGVGGLAAFLQTARYDGKVAEWISSTTTKDHSPFVRFLEHLHHGYLRYGENPHTRGELLQNRLAEGLDLTVADAEWCDAQPMPSFNNLLDADAALALCAELTRQNLKVWHRQTAGAQEKPGVWHRLSAGAASAQPKPTTSRLTAPVSGQQVSHRNLPHLQRAGATYFVTFRTLSGELSPDERDIAMECCLFPDGKTACIHAVVVMPDHVHMLVTPLESEPDTFYSLGHILHGVKGVSARHIADVRGHPGSVWQDERFDRIIRNEKEFLEKLNYICENPVTAGLPDARSYAWCVVEKEPGWSPSSDAAGVDLGHQLTCYYPGAAEERRYWHRLIAGATQGEPSPHRLIAGATQEQSQESSPAGTACAVFIKHTNACGVGIADNLVDAYRTAYLGDPNAAMGGILAVNQSVTADFAAVVLETFDRFGRPLKDAGHPAAPGAFFIEVWIAPSFTDDAVAIIRGTYDAAKAAPQPGESRIDTPPRKKWGENVRLLAIGDMSVTPDPGELVYRTIAGGMLVQSPDLLGLNEDQWKVVTKRAPTESEMSDLRFAWLIAKHTKSNAISICKNGMLIGNGAGQMSRVMSCRIATWLARENGHAEKLPGSSAASDAFFPFRDGPDLLIDAGVTALIQPGGSKRDAEVIAAADERGVAMIFTGTRHFRH